MDHLIGKYVLVGISYEDHLGNLLRRVEIHGRVEASADGLIHVRNATTGQDFTIPPEPEAFFPAPPGRHTLRSTGEVVVNPDYTARWTVVALHRSPLSPNAGPVIDGATRVLELRHEAATVSTPTSPARHPTRRGHPLLGKAQTATSKTRRCVARSGRS
jgi:hypothetical protein